MGAEAEEKDAIGDCASATDCAFEGDGNTGEGVGIVGANAGRVDRSAGSEAE